MKIKAKRVEKCNFFHKIKKKGMLKRKHWAASTGHNMHITDE